MTYDQLCQQLRITDCNEYTQLRDWCLKNISRDLQYTGTAEQQYECYRSLAKHFLEKFLPHADNGLNQRVLEFDGLNTIQFAAKCGYEFYLANLQKPYQPYWDNNPLSGMTALHFAARNGYLHTVNELIELGAQGNRVNRNQQYPIHSVLFMPNQSENPEYLRQCKTKIFHLLKKQYPDTVNATDRSGETVAHLMASYGFEQLIAELASNQDKLIFISNNAGKYPIHLAVLNKQPMIAEILLAVPEVRVLADTEGRNALDYALKYGDKEMIEICTDAYHSLDEQDNHPHNSSYDNHYSQKF